MDNDRRHLIHGSRLRDINDSGCISELYDHITYLRHHGIDPGCQLLDWRYWYHHRIDPPNSRHDGSPRCPHRGLTNIDDSDRKLDRHVGCHFLHRKCICRGIRRHRG